MSSGRGRSSLSYQHVKEKPNNGPFKTYSLFSLLQFGWLVGFMVLNATFNNISVISWQSVLFVEETAVYRENHRPVVSHFNLELWFQSSKLKLKMLTDRRMTIKLAQCHTWTFGYNDFKKDETI